MRPEHDGPTHPRQRLRHHVVERQVRLFLQLPDVVTAAVTTVVARTWRLPPEFKEAPRACEPPPGSDAPFENGKRRKHQRGPSHLTDQQRCHGLHHRAAALGVLLVRGGFGRVADVGATDEADVVDEVVGIVESLIN